MPYLPTKDPQRGARQYRISTASAERGRNKADGPRSSYAPACQMRPAPRAHLYLAPSTATGISVEYGYAGMPWANRYSAASSTWTSPASEATIGFSKPLAFISSTTSTMIFANTIGGVTIVCQ